MRIPESELIINDDGSVFHIHLRPEEIADRIIMVGDPGRVDMIAEYLTDIEFRHASREFVSTTGKFNGQRITALSHGIGPDNIDIVMTELDALANVDFATREVKPEHRTLQILRIGTSGALHADIPLGSYILSHISVGFDGVMNWYGNREKVTMPEVEKAFKEHMGWLPELPSPYFVKAGQGKTAPCAALPSPLPVSTARRDASSECRWPCRTCWRRLNRSGSTETGALPILRWRVLRWPVSPVTWAMTPPPFAAPSPTAISRAATRTISRRFADLSSWRWTA